MKTSVQFKTFSPKQSDIKTNWVIVDVKGKILGRVANKIADLLRGKGKTLFSKHVECGDHVIVINAAEVRLTGKKETDKVYNWHSRYPNGLKAITPEKLRQEKPEEIIEHAVAGMLPANKLKKQFLKHLRVFPGSEHGHTAQNPTLIEL